MQATLINNDRDLHLHHGPIDLIIRVEGSVRSVQRAHSIACNRFETILPELVSELAVLRQPLCSPCQLSGSVAKRMYAAAVRFNATFVTPMIAVAGAVADEVLAEIAANVDEIDSISVNNGGDIAIWLAPMHVSTLGVADPLSGEIVSRANISSVDGVGGIATSGRHGRSLSLGIADSVTVMAQDAATADAAATLIANAVDLPGNPKVHRMPAAEIDSDTDLGERLATVNVASLCAHESAQALQAGLELAVQLKKQNHIVAAYLLLQGQSLATENEFIQLHKTDHPTIDREYVYA